MAFGNTILSELHNRKPVDILDRLTIRRLSNNEIPSLYPINQQIFKEKRLINSLDHQILIALTADLNGKPVGFKIGYRANRVAFYSAKGGILPEFRKCGIARALLYRMQLEAAQEQFNQFYYDTFPNRYPGMYHLGLREQFKIDFICWNSRYQDYQIRLSKAITPR